MAILERDTHAHSWGTFSRAHHSARQDRCEGQGRVAYLSREMVRWLKGWLQHAEVIEGTVFRRLIGQTQIGGPLNAGSIAPIFKRVAQWIGLPERFVDQVGGGHSTRVGATQDLALDIDLAGFTQAGGWKSTRMPLQYAERINTARSGMARAAASTRRTSLRGEVGVDFTNPRVHNATCRRPSPGFLTYVLLELTIELSIKSLGKWVVSKKSGGCIHPCQRPRAGEIARASQQL
jgi:hypothetical protein